MINDLNIIRHHFTMLLVIHPKQFNKNNIMFSEKIKNNILTDGDFYRIYYSDTNFTSNGIYVAFDLKIIKIEKYFNKIKCTFDKNSNRNIISFIKDLEFNILKFAPSNKTPSYRIEEQLSQQFIKIFSEHHIVPNKTDNIKIMLKISGIWSDNSNFGTTFRFFFDN
jgi:hypothetical protein|tara:strand:- start:6925 stop:7422 length:498 start_codon:yes stop_codon:yes gene_type:complete